MESNDLILEELKKYEARTKAELLEIQNTAIKRPLVKKEKDLIFTLQSNLISANNLIKTFEDPSSEERPNSQNEMNDKFI